MDQHKNIVPDSISDEMLLLYTEGKLSAEDTRKVEEAMASSLFIGDAAEGLSEMENKDDLSDIVGDLNQHLKTLTSQQKKRLQKHKPLDINWIIIAILVLTIVAVGGYLAVHYMVKGGRRIQML